MASWNELIRTRRSCRNYEPRPLTPEDQAWLEAALGRLPAGPFGARVRVRLLDAAEVYRLSGNRLGTYGVIRNPPSFLTGVVPEAERALEDFGFVFEQLLLEATGRGLGTCWLGGTFRREAFARALALEERELIPAVSPVGYPLARRTLVDAALRFFAGSNQRKPWAELFFDGSWRTPLTPDASGPYAEPLELLRLAPSASNQQPWRVVRDAGPEHSLCFHLYLQRTAGYRKLASVDLQRIDLGIAMAHFARATEELARPGSWQLLNPVPLVGELPERTSYVVSWVEG